MSLRSDVYNIYVMFFSNTLRLRPDSESAGIREDTTFPTNTAHGISRLNLSDSAVAVGRGSQ